MPIYPFDVKDVKLAKQNNTEAGSTAPAWDSVVDMPAIQLVTLDEDEGDTQELRGDGQVVQTARTEGVGTWELRGGAQSTAIIALVYAGTNTVVASQGSANVRGGGVNGAGYVKVNPVYNATLPFFKLLAQSLNADGGDSILRIWKAQALRRRGPALTWEEGAFAPITLNGNYFWTNETSPRVWELVQSPIAASDAAGTEP